jgi:hypothetical protein
MKSNIAAAISFMQLNPIGRKEFTRCDNVLRSGIPAQRNHRRMLQQEQGVADAPVFYQLDERLLQLKRNGVIHAAKVEDVDDT